MTETLTELFQLTAAWLRGEGPLPDLLRAWWHIYISRDGDDPDQPIAYRISR